MHDKFDQIVCFEWCSWIRILKKKPHVGSAATCCRVSGLFRILSDIGWFTATLRVDSSSTGRKRWSSATGYVATSGRYPCSWSQFSRCNYQRVKRPVFLGRSGCCINLQVKSILSTSRILPRKVGIWTYVLPQIFCCARDSWTSWDFLCTPTKIHGCFVDIFLGQINMWPYRLWKRWCWKKFHRFIKKSINYSMCGTHGCVPHTHAHTSSVVQKHYLHLLLFLWKNRGNDDCCKSKIVDSPAPEFWF